MQVPTVVSRRGIIAVARRRWVVSCTSVLGRSNSALTTVTLRPAVSLSTSTSTAFHFVAGSTSTSVICVTITSTRSRALTSFSFLPGARTLAKVRFCFTVLRMIHLNPHSRAIIIIIIMLLLYRGRPQKIFEAGTCAKRSRGAADAENETPQVSIAMGMGKYIMGMLPSRLGEGSVMSSLEASGWNPDQKLKKIAAFLASQNTWWNSGVARKREKCLRLFVFFPWI